MATQVTKAITHSQVIRKASQNWIPAIAGRVWELTASSGTSKNYYNIYILFCIGICENVTVSDFFYKCVWKFKSVWRNQSLFALTCCYPHGRKYHKLRLELVEFRLVLSIRIFSTIEYSPWFFNSQSPTLTIPKKYAIL